MFYWIALLMTAVDLAAKRIVASTMSVGDSRPFLDGLLHFSYYQNSGAARSSFQGYGRLFGVVAVLFIVLVLYYRRTKGRGSRLTDAGLALLVAGAAGNGVERLLFGKVTDFLVFGSGDGILNIADLCINAGIAAVLLQQLLLLRKPKDTGVAS
ncbi:signal peptidase II [Paenibacillus sp. MWE-103]|uniref:Lipoprotein signal peptidase n=1 Tax=Paenibacillus artemisiicola TaxID=1172618 RepID=A0ABS3W3C4_9BACL|nr:signal peptidase II [Paenibacillus artemisiicola]MBO7742804.1 signal peptidase II [Paenibacillus artemisiicola]